MGNDKVLTNFLNMFKSQGKGQLNINTSVCWRLGCFLFKSLGVKTTDINIFATAAFVGSTDIKVDNLCVI